MGRSLSSGMIRYLGYAVLGTLINWFIVQSLLRGCVIPVYLFVCATLPLGAVITPFVYWRNQGFSFVKNFLIAFFLTSCSFMGGFAAEYLLFTQNHELYARWWASDSSPLEVFVFLGELVVPIFMGFLLKR